MFNWKISICLLLILCSTTTSIADDYKQIMEAYEKKQYEIVIQKFKQLDKNALPNFGVDEWVVLEAVGMSYFQVENYNEAIDLLRLVTKRHVDLKQHHDAYVSCYYLSRCFKYLYIRDSSIFYSELGAKQAALTGSKDKFSRALHNLAVVYEDIGDYTKALTTYQQSMEQVKTDTLSYMQTRCIVADVYYKIGMLDSAFKIASESYNYFTDYKIDDPWKWRATYRLANIEQEYKNEFAETYYRELLSISNNDYNIALAEIGLGETLLLKKKDSVDYYLDSALKKAEAMQNNILLREINFILARIYLDHKPNQRLLYNSIKILRRIVTLQKDNRATPYLKIIESRYFLKNNNLDSSLITADLAIQSSKKFNHKDRLSQALEQKFNVLNHFGRYKEALAVKEEQIKVQQELFNDRSEAVYQILRTQNEMDKQESTIANQQLVIDNNNLQITIQYISIALVIIALAFIFWQYRTRSKYAQKLETMFLDSRHRYMNNLLLLKNWFNEGKTENNDEIISFAQNRIDAISTVNRHLDRLSYNKDTIESKSFLEEISHSLLANREFTSDIQNVPINMSASGPLGMITNEILTNGLKYGKEPYSIRFHKNGGGYVLEIEDNGPGIKDADKKGTGSKVLRLLSRQLKGELTYANKADEKPDSHGTRVSLKFKE